MEMRFSGSEAQVAGELKRARSPSPGALRASGLGKVASPNTGAWVKEVMKFDGMGQSIEAPQPPVNVGGATGLTVAAWVKRGNKTGAYDRLIDFGNGAEKENIVINFQQTTMYEVRHEGRNQILAVDPNSRETFPQDTWVHVTLVHDADGTASIYWNSTLKVSGPVWLPPSVHREKYYVGRSHWGHDPYFKGEISDVHVFNYALDQKEIRSCCFSRKLPSSRRGAPILSLAADWRNAPRRAPLLIAHDDDGCGFAGRWFERRDCRHPGCGGIGRCGGGGGEGGDPLQFFTDLNHPSHRYHALNQLLRSCQLQREAVAALEQLQDEAIARADSKTCEDIQRRLCISHDALRRAQAVARMIRYSTRMPTGVHHDVSTGQKRRPPQLAAAFDASSGIYHAFAIYEMRSGVAIDGTDGWLDGAESECEWCDDDDGGVHRGEGGVGKGDVGKGGAQRGGVQRGSASSGATDAAASSGATNTAAVVPPPPASAAIALAAPSPPPLGPSARERPSPKRTRHGASANEDQWHVYISDLISMRHLIPGQTCWRRESGSLLINLLQRKATADNQVVVLKALNDAHRLEDYYSRIGFTNSQTAFSEAGLAGAYRNGEFLFRG